MFHPYIFLNLSLILIQFFYFVFKPCNSICHTTLLIKLSAIFLPALLCFLSISIITSVFSLISFLYNFISIPSIDFLILSAVCILLDYSCSPFELFEHISNYSVSFNPEFRISSKSFHQGLLLRHWSFLEDRWCPGFSGYLCFSAIWD